jgi:hypothetical protein
MSKPVKALFASIATRYDLHIVAALGAVLFRQIRLHHRRRWSAMLTTATVVHPAYAESA